MRVRPGQEADDPPAEARRDRSDSAPRSVQFRIEIGRNRRSTGERRTSAADSGRDRSAASGAVLAVVRDAPPHRSVAPHDGPRGAVAPDGRPATTAGTPPSTPTIGPETSESRMETSPGAEAAPPSTDDVGAGRTRALIAREQCGGGHSATPEDRRDAITGRSHPRTVPPRSDPAGGEGGDARRPGRAEAASAVGSPRRRAGRAGSRSPARSRPTAASRARGRGSWRRSTGMMPASGLASARAGPTAREERRFHARNARRSTARRPSTTRASPPRPAIRAPRDDVFTSSRGGHGPHRAPGICTGTARPR